MNKKFSEDFWLCCLIIVAVFIMASREAKATDLLVGGYTQHFYKPDTEFGSPVKEFNTNTYLLGVKYGNFSAVTYQNSYYRQSYGVYGEFGPDVNANLNMAIVGGLVSGYRGTDMPMWGELSPVVYAKFDVHPSHNKWGVVLAVAPRHFVSINFRVKL